MAKVTQPIFIEYRGGPKIQWPESMVETLDDGSKWMRRRRSNYSLCKLVLGHHEKFKKLKHASFSASVKWKELLDMQKKLVTQAIEEEGSEVFASQKSEDEQKEDFDPRTLKKRLEKMGPTMSLRLLHVDVTTRTPANFKQTDIVIKLEESQITALFNFLMEDVAAILQPKPKSWNQTRTGKKRKDDLEENDSE